jgi:large subunit ribosomal protein L21
MVNPSAAAVALRTMAARAMTTVSVAKHPHTLTPHPATEYAPAKDDQIFAVISLMGKQHKVTKDDLVVADFMGDEFDLDSKVNVDNVLLLGSKSATIVGHPTVPNTKVVLSVEEITRDKKVIALKYRRRKNSRRRKGHRRDITLLRVVDIIPDATDLGVLVPK